jgi:hypothetical protein
MARKPWTVAGIVAMVLFLGGSAVWTTAAREDAESSATGFAAPLAALCQRNPGQAAAVGTDCEAAKAVAEGKDGEAGSNGRNGENGENGTAGTPGRGILGTSVADGRLIVTYSDNTTDDLGEITGTDGRGIAATTIDGGHLVVVYSDGERVDLGIVVGPEGRGIASLDGSTGRLMVTLTDGTQLDAGPLPPGATGRDGTDGKDAPSVQKQIFYLDDGRVRVCDRSGGNDEAPEFRCAYQAPAAEGGI